jgi:hypothetical protein
MAFQLVYTSAAKLLDAGRSGYGTVARSKSITPLVVSAIERVSQFANLRGLDRNRVIHVHRRITAGSNRFHILTRIVDAGADYTGRTNHIAHHLVISQEEAARAAARGITPADVLRQFPWLDRWDGAARFFDANEDVPLDHFRPDGRNSGSQSWAALTGNPAHARLLSWEAAPRTGVLVVPAAAVDTLHLLAEALAEFGPQSWSRSFTTSLETTDELSELEWIISTPQAFPEIQSRCGSRTLFDLTHPQTLPTPPVPVMAAAAPATARQDYPGAHEAESSVSNTRQPGANPVMVNIAPSGARAAGASLRRSNPKQDKKTQIKLLVGFAALLFFAGLLIILGITYQTAPPSKVSEKTQPLSAEPRLTDQEEQAGKNLVDSGIKKSEADLIVKKAGNDVDMLVRFIKDTNNVLNGFDGSFALNDLNKLPEFKLEKEPAGSPSWVESLVSATAYLRKIPNLKVNSITAQDFLDFANAIKNLNIVLSDGYDQDHLPTKPNREWLFDEIALPWVAKIIKLKKYDELQAILNHTDIWDKSKFPARHQLLERIIDDAFNKVENPDLEFNRLFGLLEQTHEFDEQLTRIKLASTKEAGTTETKKSPPPALAVSMMSGVPDTEIILASKDDLERGVHVKLLNTIIEPHRGEETIKSEGLKIVVNGKIEDITALNSTGNHFYKYGSKIDFQILKNGNFTIPKNDINKVEISFSGKSAVILVDEASAETYDSKLNFTFNKISENSVRIEGTLTKRIDEVMPITVRNSLKITTEPEAVKPFEILRSTDGTWTLNREADHSKSFTLPENDAETIKTLLNTYLDAVAYAAANKGTQQVDNNNDNVTKAAWDELKNQLLKSFKEDPMDILLKEQNLSWAILEKENTGEKVVKTCIQKILTNSGKPDARPSPEQEIKSIKSLSVATEKGRVLFKAEPLN